jgi:hypothetical protein
VPHRTFLLELLEEESLLELCQSGQWPVTKNFTSATLPVTLVQQIRPLQMSLLHAGGVEHFGSMRGSCRCLNG